MIEGQSLQSVRTLLSETGPYVRCNAPVLVPVPENFTLAEWEAAAQKLYPLCEIACEAVGTEEGHAFRIGTAPH